LRHASATRVCSAGAERGQEPERHDRTEKIPADEEWASAEH
jgi:hypothetical protein